MDWIHSDETNIIKAIEIFINAEKRQIMREYVEKIKQMDGIYKKIKLFNKTLFYSVIPVAS
jgi:hypothetical protein